ncbi:uncharacterized protein LOC115060953 isoform X1 [Echeneis naucrates]|uniref:uncharacterized protein LOC115060953 isoform X1 n=1 Tax=Echeneis naucrates TaxID=173247 RepID=UPI0011137041|nr:uncharacterized protein LOC115060953 isoform X1 [Echeneis naucrates]
MEKKKEQEMLENQLRSMEEQMMTVPVPNPYVVLTNLAPLHKWFTCIDLANTFFCLPLVEDRRDIFSFTFKGTQWRYTCLPQGFALSPGLFNQVLKNVSECELPEGVTLVQYVNDLLLAAPTAVTCLEATSRVLFYLARAGFKVSKSKPQVTHKQVTFLGRVLSQKGASLSPVHRTTILHHPRPQKVKDMLSFLGLTGYSRQYVPNYTRLTQPLRACIREQGMRNLNSDVVWSQEVEQSFIALKQTLATAADLATPDYSCPFFLNDSGTGGVMNGVLFQKKRGERKVLMHVSVMLDRMERHPQCTQHATGLAKLIQKTAHIVMGHSLKVLTAHSVVAYVHSQAFTLTSLRQQKLSKVLDAPNITYTHEGINMAERIGVGEPHICKEQVAKEGKVRPDLQAEPLEGRVNLYTDGCCYRDEKEGLKAGYAVVQEQAGQFAVKKAEKLKGAQSAQRAEVGAVIEPLKMSAGQKVSIYTDSAYAAGAVHVELGQWLRTGFLTISNKPIKHEAEMKELAEALLLPRQVAVIKCKGHDNTQSLTAKGNEAADKAAKEVTGYQTRLIMIYAETEERNDMEMERIKEMQEKTSPQELSVWKARGGSSDSRRWRGPDGRLIPPPALRQGMFEEAHGVGHIGVTQMMRNLKEWWHPFLKEMTKEWQVGEQRSGNQAAVIPGQEWVLLKVHKRKWTEPRWTGPFQVTERTSHAVRLKGKGDTWYHWSQCAAAEEPLRTVAEVQRDLQETCTEPAGSKTDHSDKEEE